MDRTEVQKEIIDLSIEIFKMTARLKEFKVQATAVAIEISMLEEELRNKRTQRNQLTEVLINGENQVRP